MKIINFLFLIPLAFQLSNCENTENCNKLWGMTNDLNGITVSKISIYMCIDDPYNLYQNTPVTNNNVIEDLNTIVETTTPNLRGYDISNITQNITTQIPTTTSTATTQIPTTAPATTTTTTTTQIPTTAPTTTTQIPTTSAAASTTTALTSQNYTPNPTTKPTTTSNFSPTSPQNSILNDSINLNKTNKSIILSTLEYGEKPREIVKNEDDAILVGMIIGIVIGTSMCFACCGYGCSKYHINKMCCFYLERTCGNKNCTCKKKNKKTIKPEIKKEIKDKRVSISRAKITSPHKNWDTKKEILMKGGYFNNHIDLNQRKKQKKSKPKIDISRIQHRNHNHQISPQKHHNHKIPASIVHLPEQVSLTPNSKMFHGEGFEDKNVQNWYNDTFKNEMKSLPKSKNYAPPPPLPVPTLNNGFVGGKKNKSIHKNIEKRVNMYEGKH